MRERRKEPREGSEIEPETAWDELLANRAFVLKMGLVGLGGLNALWFHARGGLSRLDRVARLQTAVSVGLWLAVIICGRWIAYA